jgi:polysaccharide pyruvyl transferase WcaK-like protein
MIVEIHGAGFNNKGAELMLRTTISELKTRINNFTPAIDPGYGSYETRCNLNLKQIVPKRGHVGQAIHLKNLQRQKFFGYIKLDSLARKLLKLDFRDYGCVGINRVDALIDISGFAYTDQWDTRPTKDFANLTEFYYKQKKAVIMLPQAFGPFKRKGIKSQFKRVIKNSTLIFPRDKISFEYVFEIEANKEKIIQAPDITLFSSREPIQENLNFEEYICLVPNIRMLDQGKEKWTDKYETYLLEIAKRALRKNLKIFIVVHDSSGQDLVIANNLIRKLNSSEVEIVDEPDPYKLKRFIGNSKMLVGSRFHSLVASFSQGVPAIAIGWSHKYEMLFDEFGFGKFIISSETALENALDLIDKLSHDDQNISFRKEIRNKLIGLEAKNQEMWDLVTETLLNSIDKG